MPAHDIGTLAEKVFNLEERFEDHASRLEGKLDQIVEIMQKVASLQERENSNSEKIKELYESRKELAAEHKHMNEVMNTRMERHVSDMNMCRDSIINTINLTRDQMDVKVKETSIVATKAREEVDKWLNRGIGAWVIISSCLVLLQVVAAYFIKEVKLQNAEITQVVRQLQTTDTQNQRDILYLSKTIQEMHKQ